MRDPETGKGARDPELFKQVVDRIRASDTDVVLNLTAGMGGDLVFGSGDSDFSPTLSEAANDAPFIGFWTDLDASQGGSITASTPAPGSGIIRVDYLGVPYFGVPSPTVSFGVEIDCIAALP